VAFGFATAIVLVLLAGANAFFAWHDAGAVVYQYLAVFALAILLVPMFALGGSAARLSARRRDDRLSTLRLLGATPGLVTTLTVLEATALAVAGALAGVVGYLVLVPAVALIPFRGHALGAGTMWLPAWLVAVVILAVAALAAASAAIGLRAVVISPLGVRTRQEAPRLRWVRVVVGIVVILAVVLGLRVVPGIGGLVLILGVGAVGFGATIVVLGLVGPFVIARFARRQARRATNPVRLLASRAVLESPKGAWRQVSGVSMASFIAVFAGVGVAVASAATTDSPVNRDSIVLLRDIGTGVIILLTVAFLMVACSVSVNQASAILDRRELYVSLDRLGMETATIERARRRAVMSPVRIVALGSAVVAAVVVLPLAGIALVIAPLSLLTIALCLAGGLLLVWLGLVATRPVLARVLREPDRAV
jgi:hypothetical protein